jgi:hypothetical protein
MGTECNEMRAFNCSLQLLSPPLDCNNPLYKDPNDPKEDLLDRDPPCLIFSLEETAALRYQLGCQFNPPIDDIPPEVQAANFTYYIDSDKVLYLCLLLGLSCL